MRIPVKLYYGENAYLSAIYQDNDMAAIDLTDYDIEPMLYDHNTGLLLYSGSYVGAVTKSATKGEFSIITSDSLSSGSFDLRFQLSSGSLRETSYDAYFTLEII